MTGKKITIFCMAIFAAAFFGAVGVIAGPPPVEKKIIHGTPPLEYVGLTNSLKRTAINFTAGKFLYNANCAPCHGIDSNGQGPEARGFWPPPADFTNKETIAALKEGYLFWRIKEGGLEEPFKSAMPAFGDALTDKEIWQIIMYEYKNAGVEPSR